MHRTAAGLLACPLGSLAAEVDRDPALRPVAAAAFREWESPLAAAFAALQRVGAVRGDVDPARLAAHPGRPAGRHAARRRPRRRRRPHRQPVRIPGVPPSLTLRARLRSAARRR